MLHYALCSGVVMMIIVMFVLSDRQASSFDFSLDIFLVIGLASAAILPNLGIGLFSKQMDRLSSTPPSKREEKVRSSYIIKWALIEAPALINTMFFYLTGNYVYIIIAIALTIILLFNKPDTTS